jgi:hypothetical protein
MPIEPRIDAYGKEADGTALADYIELLALTGESLTVADLGDVISDNNWKVRSRELFFIPQDEVRDPDSEPSEDVVDAELIEMPGLEHAKWVFQILTERQELLEELYPFEVAGVRLIAKARRDVHSAYLTLLAITVAHAYHLDTTSNPRELFEQLVARVLTARGVSTIDMASAGRAAGDFVEALEAAAADVGLTAAPNAAARRTNAQEAGVDTLSHFSWGDHRAGHWVFIGQATCGRTESWGAKINQPTPGSWGPWLNCLVHPIPYLAVPHHAEERHVEYLTDTHRKLVLDRIRLCRHVGEPSAEEATLLDEVLAEEVVRL